MIDLGQHIPRHSQPVHRDWIDVKGTTNRGQLCVIRSSNGTPEIFKLDPKENWKEWSGAFSAL